MKKYKIWSMMMLVVMALPLMVACGDDDSDSNDGTAAAYTEQEIMDILIGSWDVSGNLTITFNDKEYQEKNFSGEYTGELTFDPNETNEKTYIYKIFGGDKLSDYYPEVLFIKNNYPYSYNLIRKDGNNYIKFDSSDDCYFEIQSLTKTSFRLVLDQDLKYYNSETKERIVYHVRMTINSK